MNNALKYALIFLIAICLLALFITVVIPGSENSSDRIGSDVPSVSYDKTPVQFADINGVSLGYREFGSGEPLLMIEGFGATMDGWNETFIGILASKFHVYTYDHRGIGYSSNNNASPSIAQYANDAATLISALGYDSMHVYGASMGSSTSQQLVIDHPERVRKLILDSNTYTVLIPETKVLHEIIETVANNSSEPLGLRNEAKANLEWNGSFDGLSGINKDVMLVVGTEDILTPDILSLQIAGQINGSWLVRFKGLPHTGYHKEPVLYGQNALNFLEINESPA
ncbi:MAG: alpha/beta hydrolase [Methanomicrobiales archaeon]|nr:alpha/beta hydrolase [Methanomicrobiales archaeon]